MSDKIQALKDFIAAADRLKRLTRRDQLVRKQKRGKPSTYAATYGGSSRGRIAQETEQRRVELDAPKTPKLPPAVEKAAQTTEQKKDLQVDQLGLPEVPKMQMDHVLGETEKQPKASPAKLEDVTSRVVQTHGDLADEKLAAVTESLSKRAAAGDEKAAGMLRAAQNLSKSLSSAKWKKGKPAPAWAKPKWAQNQDAERAKAAVAAAEAGEDVPDEVIDDVSSEVLGEVTKVDEVAARVVETHGEAAPAKLAEVTGRLEERAAAGDEKAARMLLAAKELASKLGEEADGVLEAEDETPQVGKPVTFKTYRGTGRGFTNDHGVAGKGEYSSGDPDVAKAYAGPGGKVVESETSLSKPLTLNYQELNKLQEELYGKALTGFEPDLSEKFDAWLRSNGFDGVVLYDPEISTTIPQEVVRLGDKANSAPEQSPSAPPRQDAKPAKKASADAARKPAQNAPAAKPKFYDSVNHAEHKDMGAALAEAKQLGIQFQGVTSKQLPAVNAWVGAAKFLMGLGYNLPKTITYDPKSKFAESRHSDGLAFGDEFAQKHLFVSQGHGDFLQRTAGNRLSTTHNLHEALHEFAHVVGRNPDADKASWRRGASWLMQNRDRVKAEVSEYAAESGGALKSVDPDEVIPEMFVGLLLGKDYSPDLMQAYRDVGGLMPKNREDDPRIDLMADAPDVFDWSNPGGADSKGNHARTTKVGDSTIIYGVGSDGTAELISLRTPQAKRRAGSARAAMQKFLDEADSKGVTVKLGASPLDKKTHLGKLVEFYKSLGFELTGRRINAAGDPEMVRKPKSNPRIDLMADEQGTRQAFDLAAKNLPDAESFNEADYRPEVIAWAKKNFGDRLSPAGRAAWINFVVWFGDSKAVDEDGNPVLVHHGTAKGGFKAFDPAKISEENLFGPGFYFTEDADVAKEYQEKDAVNKGWEISGPIEDVAFEATERLDHLQRYNVISKESKDYGKLMIKKFAKANDAKSLAEIIYDLIGSREKTGLIRRAKNTKAETFSGYVNIRNPFDMDKPLEGKAFEAIAKQIATPVPNYKPSDFAVATTPMGDRLKVKVTRNGKVVLDTDTLAASFDEAAWKRAVADSMNKKHPADTWQLRDGGGYHFIEPGITGERLYQMLKGIYSPKDITAKFRAAGFDGITHIGGGRIGDRAHRVWIAFEPEQFKHKDNDGTFGNVPEFHANVEDEQSPYAVSHNDLLPEPLKDYSGEDLQSQWDHGTPPKSLRSLGIKTEPLRWSQPDYDLNTRSSSFLAFNGTPKQVAEAALRIAADKVRQGKMPQVMYDRLAELARDAEDDDEVEGLDDAALKELIFTYIDEKRGVSGLLKSAGVMKTADDLSDENGQFEIVPLQKADLHRILTNADALRGVIKEFDQEKQAAFEKFKNTPPTSDFATFTKNHEEYLGLMKRKPLVLLQNEFGKDGKPTGRSTFHAVSPDVNALKRHAEALIDSYARPASEDHSFDEPEAPDHPPLAGHAAAAHESAVASMAHLSPDLQQTFSTSLAKVLAAMPEAAVKTIAGLKFEWHGTPEEMMTKIESLGGRSAEQIKALRDNRQVLGGAFIPQINGKPLVILDGGKEKQGTAKSGKLSRPSYEYYAHELTHHVDTRLGEISDKPAWQSAYRAELFGGKLTKYATLSAREGFAEFGRAVYAAALEGRTDTLAALREKFPQSWAVFAAAGLVPDVAAAKGFVDVLDVFEGKVPLDSQGGHADVAISPMSEGKPVKTETPEFKAWFGESKVVDKKGPKQVYHGSRGGDFKEFDFNQLGTRTGANSARKGFFFSDNAAVAESYAKGDESSSTALSKNIPDRIEDLQSKLEFWEREAAYAGEVHEDEDGNGWSFRVPLTDMFGSEYYDDSDEWFETEKDADDALFDYAKAEAKKVAKELKKLEKLAEQHELRLWEGGTVIPAYLSIKNPLVYDYEGGSYRDKSFSELLDEAIEDGHDGVIMNNVRDANEPGGGEPSTVYVAFRPEQIKSAIANRGTFDPNDPRIDYIFDEPREVQVTTSTPDEFEAKFSVGGTDFRFTADTTVDGVWSVRFAREDVKDGYKQIKDGTSATEVFSNVAECMRKLLEHAKPMQVNFSANNREKSRVDLYRMLSKRAAKKWGFIVEEEDDDDNQGGDSDALILASSTLFSWKTPEQAEIDKKQALKVWKDNFDSMFFRAEHNDDPVGELDDGTTIAVRSREYRSWDMDADVTLHRFVALKDGKVVAKSGWTANPERARAKAVAYVDEQGGVLDILPVGDDDERE